MDTAAFLSLYGLVFVVVAGYVVRRTTAHGLVQPPAAAEGWTIAAWLAMGLALRLPMLWDPGFHYDTGTFKAWALTASDPAAPLHVYKEGYFAHYPPFYMYLLGGLGALVRLIGWEASSHFTALIKLPALLADAATALILLRELRPRLGEGRGWGLASLYWLNPVMIFAGALWGQVESLLCLLLVLGWLAWRSGRLYLAAAVFAVAVAFRPQGVLYAAIFGVALLSSAGWRRNAVAFAVGVITYSAIVLPFAWSRSLDWLLSLYSGTAGGQDFITINAYNVWALMGWNWKQDAGSALGLTMQRWAAIDAAIAIAAIAVYLGVQLRRLTDPQARGSAIAWAFALATIALFMLAPRMHERDIMMLLPMLFLLDPARVRLPLIVLWTAASLANISYVYYHYIELDQVAPGDTLFIRVSAAANVALSVLTVLYWQLPDWPARLARCMPPRFVPRVPVFVIPDPVGPPAERWGLRHSLVTLGFIVVATAIGLYRLGTTNYPVSGLKSDGFSVEYRYDRPVRAHTALIYAGEGTAKLRLERHDAEGWVEVIPERELSDIFKLHETSLKTTAPSTRYRWQISATQWRVNELALLDMDGNPLPPDALAEPSLPPVQLQALVDEPTTWVAGRGYLASPYFDEIYHARTGYEYLNRLPVYDNTHPPLGKWFISLSIDALGMTPFGWRFVGVLASALTVGVLAWGGWLFNGRSAAMLLTGGLGLFEFSRFTLGRYATIDSYLGLFVLLCVLFLWRQFGMTRREDWRDGWRLSPALVAAGASLGAAGAVKWNGLYAGLGVFLFFLVSVLSGLRRDGAWQWRATALRSVGAGVAFALVPALIYYFSYIPFLRCLPDSPDLLTAKGFSEFVRLQRDTFSYHANLTATHPFSSRFWSWPLNLKPLWIFTGEGQPRTSITIIGNPLIWWGGLLLVAAALWQNLRKVQPDSLLLLGSWAALYLPWALIGRATFNYHYYPAALMLILLLGNTVTRWGEHPRLRWLPITILFAAGGLFAWFYPAISGAPAPEAWFASLRWLPTWWML